MRLSIVTVSIAMCRLCTAGDSENVERAADDSSNSVKNALDCSLDNLREMIGHNEFSLLGKNAACSIFYMAGDNIDDAEFDLETNRDISRGCKDPVPLLYKKGGEYKVAMTQKRSLYTEGCVWEECGDYKCCTFDRQVWKKSSVEPDKKDIDEIIGHVTDVDTDILHVLYKDELATVFDSMYNLSSGAFVKDTEIEGASFKLSSFDSDLMRLYYEANKLGYEEVESENGIFKYRSNHKELSNFNESDYTAFSFSNGYYLAKKKHRHSRELYFVGHEESAEQMCVLNSASKDAVHLQLFVGDKVGSVHTRLRAQLSPKKTTAAPSYTTSPSSSPATSLVHMLYIILVSLLAY